MIKAIFFGRTPYNLGLRIQEIFYDMVKLLPACHFLCLLEHPPTYTVGIRGEHYPLEEEQRLKNLGAEFHRVRRGGLITFHGPGQLVVYPIFNLRSLQVDQNENKSYYIGPRKFVHLIEEVVIQLLTDHFVLKNVGRTNDAGVWIEQKRKIAALGVQFRNGITTHGLALNCDTDLKWFEHIIPCGLEGKSATSISRESGIKISPENILQPICDRFQAIFGLPVELSSFIPPKNQNLDETLLKEYVNTIIN